ncbi:peptide-methionine (S)-S-oxide reductase MsrA [Patescibacteria group bacterium]|nr:peptide-methionine (S)-S-oxide reductase MsrA [Candidatus Paceibacterota bacterium]MBP9710571.1 peptide-methionine (S)-S-oxide reductase MsrA [Patescibacteria group bacterium]
MSSTTQIAIFGGGCFWCIEAVFEQLKGVVSVMPGYAGGQTQKPTYDAVCSGETGHAEVLRIEYDPAIISYNDLLTVFFAAHNPTTLNRQGNDVGTQYRSIILYTTEEQKSETLAFIKDLNEGDLKNAVVTEVVPLETFYEAEAYHHHYFLTHPEQAYCQFVINPKLEKVRERFSQLMQS